MQPASERQFTLPLYLETSLRPSCSPSLRDHYTNTDYRIHILTLSSRSKSHHQRFCPNNFNISIYCASRLVVGRLRSHRNYVGGQNMKLCDRSFITTWIAIFRLVTFYYVCRMIHVKTYPFFHSGRQSDIFRAYVAGFTKSSESLDMNHSALVRPLNFWAQSYGSSSSNKDVNI